MRHFLRFSSLMLATVVVMAFATVAQSQLSPRFSAGATGTAVNAVSVLSNGRAEMSGTLYGGEGTASWHRLTLRAGYAEGTLGIGASQPGSATGSAGSGGVVGGLLDGLLGPGGSATPLLDFKMVDGYAFVGWNMIEGLALETGIKARARVVDSESERLLLLVARAGYEAPLITERVRGFLQGWTSITGSASGPDQSASGRGGAAGLVAEFGPVGLRMSYGIDRARYRDESRLETVEGLTLSLAYILR